MQISKYTVLAELTKSQTAVRLGIDNTPSAKELKNLQRVCTEVFDKVREHFGVPIVISCGFRSKKLNDVTPNSSKNSQHCKGEALDIDGDVLGGVTNSEIFHWIKENLDFDQLIWEFGDEVNPDWVHVSYSDKNRKQVLRAMKLHGKIVYVSMI